MSYAANQRFIMIKLSSFLSFQGFLSAAAVSFHRRGHGDPVRRLLAFLSSSRPDQPTLDAAPLFHQLPSPVPISLLLINLIVAVDLIRLAEQRRHSRQHHPRSCGLCFPPEQQLPGGLRDGGDGAGRRGPEEEDLRLGGPHAQEEGQAHVVEVIVKVHDY